MPIVPESWYACASLSICAESFALPCGPVPPDIAAVHAARALIVPWPITGEKALENTVRQQAKNLTHIVTELVNG